MLDATSDTGSQPNANKSAPDKSKPAVSVYVPTAQERAARQRGIERSRSRPPPPRVKIEERGNEIVVKGDHVEPRIGGDLLMDALATGSGEFAHVVAGHLTELARKKGVTKSEDLNELLATVHAIAPRDEIEALLAVQMAAIHNATIVAAKRLSSVETIQQQDSASGMLNKLARTFACQIETLKKHRSTGEQSIRVQHVTVNEGGQAIVAGKMETRGRGKDESGDQPHEPCGAYQSQSAVDERGPALLGNVETLGGIMPGTCGEGLDRLPVSRSTRRGAQG